MRADVHEQQRRDLGPPVRADEAEEHHRPVPVADDRVRPCPQVDGADGGGEVGQEQRGFPRFGPGVGAADAGHGQGHVGVAARFAQPGGLVRFVDRGDPGLDRARRVEPAAGLVDEVRVLRHVLGDGPWFRRQEVPAAGRAPRLEDEPVALVVPSCAVGDRLLLEGLNSVARGTHQPAQLRHGCGRAVPADRHQ